MELRHYAPTIVRFIILQSLSFHQTKKTKYPVPIQALCLGDVAFCGLPGEMFVETGLDIKSKSPFRQNFIVELANAAWGYVPLEEHFQHGGYETLPNTYSVLTKKAEKLCTQTALKLLKNIYSEI